MSYQSKHVATLYNISQETLRKWTIEFKDYLSDSANPGTHKQRFYTVADLEVIALIAEQKKAAYTFEEIHAALLNGQRGQAPELQPEELEAISRTDDDTQLAIQNAHLRHNLALAQEALKKAEERLQALREAQQAKAVAEAQLEALKASHSAEVDTLRGLIDDLNTQLREIAKEAGKQYSEGFKDGWKERNETSGE